MENYERDANYVLPESDKFKLQVCRQHFIFYLFLLSFFQHSTGVSFPKVQLNSTNLKLSHAAKKYY